MAVGDALALDAGRRLPGRGAHLHPDLHCLELAERRGALPRALRRAGALDAAALRVALGQLTHPRTTDPREG